MPRSSRPSVVVIGAGIGGLTAAAVLARAGLPVTVLDAHVYPGGCAATFRHRGHWFDAGATLVAGLAPGGALQLVARAAGIERWPGRPIEPAMVVHLLDEGLQVPRFGSEQRHAIYEAVFPGSQRFWCWQERTADLLWDFAFRLPELHPRRLATLRSLAAATVGWLASARPSPSLALDLARPLSAHLPADPVFRRFIDAQLLIAAQATADAVYALYGAAALDLPRQGVVELAGGTGTVARLLAEAVQRYGGTVLLRQEVVAIAQQGSRWSVRTNRDLQVEADIVIANLTPWTLGRLWPEAPNWFHRRIARPPRGWSAFLLYASLDASAIPAGIPTHHQVIGSGSLGEGRSVFLSLSPEWDSSRAPTGRRSATLSTHTRPEYWWQLATTDPSAYEAAIAAYTDRIIATVAAGLEWFPRAVRWVLPGSPLAIQRFVRRPWGWVGGFPQRHPLVSWPTEIATGLYLVGDSVFPGQSIPATALAGMRVAALVLHPLGKAPLIDRDEPEVVPPGTSLVG
ncbi:FAD-dependent oxidoreductase [Thermomicrobium sp. 4228-Ro]|uniref:FAD-dependent oxidoreductase n=1 Tax=Thermomicrobium sp. 4228-Ro TaxID=2993937 RepID=UPI002248C9C8|nr:FAD-dependent oxidoreductase [Thermomicrobium sp. 4228-Ro]MCX2726595.1 FAD-dependent oxidoreductase [Thermomicrobium sp. 4228-Ro]